MNVQIIKKSGQPERAVLTSEEYLQLADAAGISTAYLSQIESGKR